MNFLSLRTAFPRSLGPFILTLLSGFSTCDGATVTELPAWLSEGTGIEVQRQEIVPAGVEPDAVLPTVIYLKNLAAPRVGRESDESIIESFLSEGMLVVTMDYADHPQARVPFINRDFVNLRWNILEDYPKAFADKAFPVHQPMNQARIFIIPEGCRLLQNVTYASPLEMDIIYPADPVLPAGAILQFSADNANRMGNFSLAVTHDSILPAQASEGFAVAMAAHPVYGGYSGIDYMPHSAWYVQAAVQTLRAQKGILPLNGRIAPLGFSRGSGVALMAVTTTAVEEWTFYRRRSEDIVYLDSELNIGPYPEEDASVQGAVIMSGRFTYIDLLPTDEKAAPGGLYTQTWGPIEENFDAWRDAGALDYLHEDPGIPLFLTINKDDEHAHHQMDVLRSRLTELGTDYIFMEDTEEERAHRMPLVHEILNAMNRYLKKALMDPDPYTGVANLRSTLAVSTGNTLQWHALEPMPPADYVVEISNNLKDWGAGEVVHPDTEGILSREWAPGTVGARFVRVLPPADPVEAASAE